MEVVEGWVMELVFLEGRGEEEAEERPAEDCSDLVTTLLFIDCLLLAILRNLCMMSVLRIPRVMMGPTLRKISLTTR